MPGKYYKRKGPASNTTKEPVVQGRRLIAILNRLREIEKAAKVLLGSVHRAREMLDPEMLADYEERLAKQRLKNQRERAREDAEREAAEKLAEELATKHCPAGFEFHRQGRYQSPAVATVELQEKLGDEWEIIVIPGHYDEWYLDDKGKRVVKFSENGHMSFVRKKQKTRVGGAAGGINGTA